MELLFFILGMVAITGGAVMLIGTGPLDMLAQQETHHKNRHIPPAKDLKIKITGIIVVSVGLFIVIFRLP